MTHNAYKGITELDIEIMRAGYPLPARTSVPMIKWSYIRRIAQIASRRSGNLLTTLGEWFEQRGQLPTAI